MSEIKIIYGQQKYFPSFKQSIDVVAKEKIYVEMISGPSLEQIENYHGPLIDKGAPIFFALVGEQVVGWCDISPIDNPRKAHRGYLGMGILPQYREQGLGSRLLEKIIPFSRDFGLEKIELEVYTENTRAVALYEKFGFQQEGLITKYRKLEGRYFDAILMALSL